MPLSVSVSNLECYRVWSEDEDLDLGWLLTRLLGKEPPTESMEAGTAFHSALEQASVGELGALAFGDYRFDFNCDCTIAIPSIRELPVQKMYDDLEVRGRVDGVWGKKVVDYKTTGQFDPDRFMESYQWRFYLDMLDCDEFQWDAFVLAEFGPPKCYEVRQFHRLVQRRYPNLQEDCARLAREYSHFISNIQQLAG